MVNSSCFVFAHVTKIHNKEIESVLFANKNNIQNNSSLNLLLKATALALDYYKEDENKEEYFNDLKNCGVQNIPEPEVLRYTAGGWDHQKYTHLGWNHSYNQDRGNWEMRKLLLVSTVNHVFNFRDKNIKSESFAALLYEIHILGDHIGCKFSTYHNRSRLKLCPDLTNPQVEFMNANSDGRFQVNPTLIGYLLYHIERLFREQKHSDEYKSLVTFLRSKMTALVHTQITDDNYHLTVIRLAEEIKRELVKYIPILLKRETFFARVFY